MTRSHRHRFSELSICQPSNKTAINTSTV